MQKSIEQRLAAIAERVRALPSRDPERELPGARPPAGHDHALGKRLSERKLREIEKRLRVQLPAAYRGFLKTIGDGGAGPGLGLSSLEQALAGQRRVARSFPWSTEDAQRLVHQRAGGDPQATVGDATLVPGVLRLGDDGQGGQAFLVVSGEQRAKVWTSSPRGWHPNHFVRSGRPVQHTFLTWYEAWLRVAYRETHVPVLDPPPGDRWNLNGKLVGRLPDELFDQVHVVELSLAANRLRRVPDAIGRLGNLRKLDLGSNRLETLPDSIGELVQLEELDLSGNRFAEFPRGVCRLVALRVLQIQQNPLRELPDTVGALRSLRRLALGDTQLKRLQRTLGSIPVEELQLNGVRLEDWRDLRLLAASGTLKSLWLSMNPALERIPDPVFDIGSLEYLVLGSTRIREIPTDIALLENLRALGLAGTQVRALPPVLGELPALKRVVLQNAPVPADELERARQRWPHIEFEA